MNKETSFLKQIIGYEHFAERNIFVNLFLILSLLMCLTPFYFATQSTSLAKAIIVTLYFAILTGGILLMMNNKKIGFWINLATTATFYVWGQILVPSDIEVIITVFIMMSLPGICTFLILKIKKNGISAWSLLQYGNDVPTVSKICALMVSLIAVLFAFRGILPKRESTRVKKPDCQECGQRVLIPALKNGMYGYINRCGEWIIEPKFPYANSFSKCGLAMVRVNNHQFGYIDSLGNIAISPDSNFNNANDFSEDGHARVHSVNYGYIDSKGNFAIGPKFAAASNFAPNGMACVLNNDKYGFIDKTGSYTIEPNFDEVTDFSEKGLAVAWYDKEAFLINTQGAIVKALPSEVNAARKFHNGRAAVCTRHHKWGFINEEGKYAIEPQYYDAMDFCNGMAAVKAQKYNNIYEWGFIDTAGTMLIQPSFYYADSFSANGLTSVTHSTPFFVIDKTGQKAFDKTFTGTVHYLEDNLAVARKYEGKVGWLDKNGNWVLKPQFDGLSPLVNGLAAASINGKYGYIDKSGNWVIKPKFDHAYNFAANGLACVEVDDKYGYIDKTGNIVIKPQFDLANDFADNGLALVKIEKDGYIDTNGNFVDYTPQADNDNDDNISAAEQSNPETINNQYSLIDSTKMEALKSKFADIEIIQGVIFANPKDSHLWGIIDNQGNFIVDPQFEKVSH